MIECDLLTSFTVAVIVVMVQGIQVILRNVGQQPFNFIPCEIQLS